MTEKILNCSGVSALGAVAESVFSVREDVEDDAGDGFLLEDDDVVYLESFSLLLKVSFSLVSRTESLSLLEEEETSLSLIASFVDSLSLLSLLDSFSKVR